MKVFIADNSFEGVWPVGTAAVIVAENAEIAAERLNEKLRKADLKGDQLPEELFELDTTTDFVYIICDGDY